MTAVTFLHTSDLQIGMCPQRLDADAQARFEAARLEAVRTLGRRCLEHDCAFLVMAGDVFEYNSVSPRTLGRAREVFAELPVPCYVLPGNHDPLTADSVLRRLAQDVAGVHLLEDSTPLEVAPEVDIVGAPLLAKHATRDLVAEACAGLEPTDRIRLVVGHGAVLNFGDDADDLIDVAALDELAHRRVIDYVALGDTHSAGPCSAQRRVWYSGAPEVTDFLEPDGGGENNSGKALVVTVDKPAGHESNVEVTEVAVGQWRFLAAEQEITTPADVTAFLDWIAGLEDKDRTVVKYALRGTIDVAGNRALESDLERYGHVFAALYPRTRLMDLHVEPTSAELADLQLHGIAGQALQELLDADERDAVNLLFRLQAGIARTEAAQ